MTQTPVVDSHHHFWDPSRRDYYWMGGDELASIRKPMGPEDLRPLLAQNNVDRTVIVQTVPTVEETEEFLSIAAGTDFVAGVVGWVDLTDPDVGDTLAELKAGVNGKYLVHCVKNIALNIGNIEFLYFTTKSYEKMDDDSRNIQYLLDKYDNLSLLSL